MFTDDTAACMLVGEQAFVMLLSREKFAEFAKLPIGDPTTHGYMYTRSFYDLDGHGWQVMWMDPAAASTQDAEAAA